jgi:CHAT domain-containing protein
MSARFCLFFSDFSINKVNYSQFLVNFAFNQSKYMLIFHRAVATFSFLLLTSSVAFAQEISQPNFALRSIKTAQNTPQTDGQQPQKATEPSDLNRVAAEKAEAEAQTLDKQDAPLLTQVIPKWEEALKYWRLAGDREKEVQTFLQIAIRYFGRGEYTTALEYGQRSLLICKELANPCEVAALTLLAVSYENVGEYQKAIDLKLNIPSLFPTYSSKALPSILTNVGQIYNLYLGNPQKALAYYHQALVLWKEKGDVIKQAHILEEIAYYYYFLGENAKSIDMLKQAYQLDPEYKRDKTITSFMYTLLANSTCPDKWAQLKQPPISDSAESSSKPSAKVESLGTTNPENIESLQKSIQKYHKQENLRGEADSLDLLASSEYKRVAEYQKALEVYQQALQLIEKMGAKPKEAEILTKIADILNEQGNKQEAINKLNQALAIQRQLKTLPEEADTLKILGQVYESLGAYEISLGTYNNALSIYRAAGNRTDETTTLMNIGKIYRTIQDYPQALRYYQQALSLSRMTENCFKEAFAQRSISQTYLDSGDYLKAINLSNQLLNSSRIVGTEEQKLSLEAQALNILAKANIKQGNYAKALDYSQKARNLSQKSGYRTVESGLLTTTAETYETLKQPNQAIQVYHEQLSLNRSMGLQTEQAQSLYNIARLQQQTQQLPEALQQINEAIALIESIRQSVTRSELRTSFFAAKQDYYELKISILMEMHQQDPRKGFDVQAFETSERARARTLLELLNEANADIRNGVDPVLLEQSKTLQYKLAALDKRWSELINGKFTPEQKNAFEKGRKQLLEQYQDIEAQIRAKSPKYAALTQPQPLKLPQIQQKVLDNDTVLLQYSLGKTQSYLWAVTNTGLTSYKLPSQPEIEKEAKQFLFKLKNSYQTFPPTNFIPSPLSSMILAPASEQLTGKKRVLIVADGLLNYIPFNALALPQQQKLLISQYEIINAPSSSTVGLLRQETQNRSAAAKTLAILADPVFSNDDPRVQLVQANKPRINPSSSLDSLNLNRSLADLRTGKLARIPGTGNEAKNILQLIPDRDQTSVVLDFDASLAAATNPQLSQYRIVHYATHGILNSESPELSGVVLSLVNEQGEQRDGFLNLNKIFNLNLPANLVVLSACQTGLGKEVKGEGIVGLTRGFMYAGSPRVIVSLWNVADDATAFLMSRFYHYLLQEKLTPAAALRAAQLEIQGQTEHPNWHSPFYWAAFTLQGEWR